MNIEKKNSEIEVKDEATVLAEGSGVFILKKEIDINGEKVSSLAYNFDKMTARDKQNISLAYKKAGNGVSMQEFDSVYHLYLFAGAVAKEDPSIDNNDVFRMSAKDACRAEALARNFFFLDLED